MALDLSSVSERLNEAWIPINAQSLVKIQECFDTCSPEMLKGELITCLKEDYSLFLYAIRELSIIHSARGVSFDNPIELIRLTDASELRTLFDRKRSDISIHALDDIAPYQSNLIGQAMLSAVSSELIAPAFELSSELAYSCALLRQIGLTLIAWNYPSIFERAIRSSVPISEYLTTMMGFSPVALAVALGRRWGLAPTLRRAIGDREAKCDTSASERAELIERVCRMGETLARTCSPQGYPKQRAKWDKVKEEIALVLGTDGLHALQDCFTKAMSAYCSYAPELISLPDLSVVEEMESSLERREHAVKSLDNLYIKDCPSEIRAKLQTLYDDIRTTGEVQPSHLNFLWEHVVSSGLFSGAGVFLLDPEQRLLVPRYVLGSPAMNDWSSIIFASASTQEHPVVKAFASGVCVEGEFESATNKTVLYAAFPCGKRAGIFYVEFLASRLSPYERAKAERISSARAIAKALGDCLELSKTLI